MVTVSQWQAQREIWPVKSAPATVQRINVELWVALDQLAIGKMLRIDHPEKYSRNPKLHRSKGPTPGSEICDFAAGTDGTTSTDVPFVSFVHTTERHGTAHTPKGCAVCVVCAVLCRASTLPLPHAVSASPDPPRRRFGALDHPVVVFQSAPLHLSGSTRSFSVHCARPSLSVPASRSVS